MYNTESSLTDDSSNLPVSRSLGSGDLTDQQRFPGSLQDAVLGLVRRFLFESRVEARYGKILSFAFEVDDEVLKKINQRIIEQFQRLPLSPPNQLEFSGQVRFSDLTTATFKDFAKLLDRAAEQRDPERLTLSWNALLSYPIGEEAYTKVDFITEKPLETEVLSALEFHRAQIAIDIGGPDQEWVDSMVRSLLPILEVTRIGGVYRPLMIFRSGMLINLLSLTTGAMGQATTIKQLSDRFEKQATLDAVRNIINKVDINEKFNAYVRFQYSDNGSILVPLLIFGLSMFVFGLFYLGGQWVYPRLVPRSAIALGLAKHRWSRNRNVFNLLVVTVLLSGIILPIIRGVFGF